MRKISQSLITLPLLAIPFMGMKPVAAEPFTPLAAIELLARSKATDARCRHLAPVESQELSDYVARAEIAAATRTSVSETQAAIAAGRKAGAAALCGPDSLAETRLTLNAARTAMAAVETEEPVETPAPALAAPKKIAAGPVETVKRAPVSARSAPAAGLNGYSAAAVGYYVDQRCRHLSAREAKRFYAGILRSHQSALSASGKKAVAAMLRQAQAQANGVACGTRSASIVSNGLASAIN